MHCANWLSRGGIQSPIESVKAAWGASWNCEVGGSFVCSSSPASGAIFPRALCVALPTRWDSPQSICLICIVQSFSSRRGASRGRISQKKKKQTRPLLNINPRASQPVAATEMSPTDEHPCVCAFLQGQRGHFRVGVPYTHQGMLLIFGHGMIA